MNFYVESTESTAARAPAVLYPTPGLKLFSSLQGGNSVRGGFTINQNYYAVCGPNLYKVEADGTANIIGNVGDDGFPVSFASNTQTPQAMVVSGGGVYASFPGNVWSGIGNIQGPVAKCGFQDGYFIVLLQDSTKFQLSQLYDATTFDPLDVFEIERFYDNAVSMLVDHGEVWFFGQKQIQVYVDTGDADNPFQPIDSGFIEQGIIAKNSPVRMDNSVFWLGGDERGSGVAWRAQGYTPARVSTHATELAWQGYPTMSDAVSYSWQYQGHSFWQINFPSANNGNGATWVYDAATGLWHERGFWDTTKSQYIAHRSQNHAFCFGKHLVGDWKTGNVYETNIGIYDDFGSVIRRNRRAPAVGKIGEWNFYHQLELEMENGLALQSGQGSDPVALLRWSNDGGHTWSNFYEAGVGKVGQYDRRVFWRRLGRAWGTKGRIFDLVVSDAIPWRLTECDLLASGYQPQERLPDLLRKGA